MSNRQCRWRVEPAGVGRGPRRRAAIRTGVILGLCVLFVALIGGGYWLYLYRRAQNTQALHVEAEQAINAGDWATAARTYRQYLHRVPEDTAALSCYSEALFEQVTASPAMVGEAIRVLRRVVGLRPDDVVARQRLADLYLRVGDFKVAEEVASEWVSRAPDNAEAVAVLAKAQHGLGRTDDAVATLREGVARLNAPPVLEALLVRILTADVNEVEEARRRLTRALAAHPDHPDLHLAAFFLALNDGERTTADRHIRRAIELAPERLDVLLPGIAHHLSTNRLDDANALLERAIAVAPQDRRVLLARADLADRRGDATTMTSVAHDLVAAASERDFDLLARAADVYIRVGRLDAADTTLTVLETLVHRSADRSGSQARAIVATLQGARDLHAGDYFSATRHLQRAVDLRPEGTHAAMLLADAYLAIGDATAALNTLEAAAQRSPSVADLRSQLADVAFQQGRCDRVKQLVSEAEVSDKFVDTEQIPPDGRRAHRASLGRLAALACQLQDEADAASWLAERTEHQRLIDDAVRNADDLAVARWALRCLVLSDQLDEARQLADRWRAIPGRGEALDAELGRLLIARRQYETALTFADAMLTRDASRSQGHVLKVRALIGQDRLADAADHARSQHAEPELASQLLVIVGDAFLAADNETDALAAFRRAAQLNPDSFEAVRRIVAHTPDLDEARRLSDELRRMEGEDGWRWKYALASALLARRTNANQQAPTADEATQARTLLEACLAARPEWVAARLKLGYACELSGTLRDAVEAYETAIAQDESLISQPVGLRLVSLLDSVGREQDAARWLDRVAAVVPPSPALLETRLRHQLRRGQIEAALDTARAWVDLAPDDPEPATALAQLYLRTGALTEAERLARRLVERFPDSVEITRTLAQALIAQGRGDESVEAVQRAAARGDLAVHHLLRAEVLLALGQTDAAREAVLAAESRATVTGKDVQVWAGCVTFWGRVGDRSRQINAARRMVEASGGRTEHRVTLARILAGGSEDERSEAHEIVHQLLRHDPENAEALVVDARLALTAQPPDLRRAEANLQRVLGADTDHLAARKLLASLQAETGRLDAALKTAETGLHFAPHDIDLLMTVARVYCHRGAFDRAIPVLERVLDRQPQTEEAVRLMSLAYDRTGNVTRGIETLEELVAAGSGTITTTMELARLYESRGDLEQAAALLDQARETAPTSSVVFSAYLEHLARQGDFGAVLAATQARRAESPDDAASLLTAGRLLAGQAPDTALRAAGFDLLEEIAAGHSEHALAALLTAGLCHYHQGDHAAAERTLTRAHALDPAARGPVNALAWLVGVDLQRPMEARAIIDRFLEAGGSEDARLMDTHAAILLALGEPDAARKKLDECLRVVGPNSTRAAAHYRMAIALQRTGRQREALPYATEALRLADRVGGLSDAEREDAVRMAAAATGSLGQD